jgi:hypothetical protein
MSEKRIDDLKEILAKAAARDGELVHTLEGLGTELMKALGSDEPPVWGEIKATGAERQLNEHFIMENKWVRGALLFDLAPDKRFIANLQIRKAAHDKHEVGTHDEPSRTIVIDPPDEKERAEAKKKFFDQVIGNLEVQVRDSVDFPVE